MYTHTFSSIYMHAYIHAFMRTSILFSFVIVCVVAYGNDFFKPNGYMKVNTKLQ